MFLHATEDEAKTLESVGKVMSIESQPAREELQGHFGNGIVRVTYHLVAEEADRVFSAMASRLAPGLKLELRENLAANLDEHSALYLRFDKQLLIGGAFGFAAADPVRVRVKPRIFLMKGGALGFYARMLGLDA